MIQPLAVAKSLAIPTFAIFDSDAHAPDKNGSRTKHAKDNMALLRLCGYPVVEPLPEANCWGDGIAMWKSEMGLIVAEDYGKDNWSLLSGQADIKYGHAGGLNKNALHIAEMLECSWKDHGPSPTLERLCVNVLAYAEAANLGDLCRSNDLELAAALDAVSSVGA